MRDMRDVRAMHVMRTMKCVKCNMKWREMRAMQFFDFGYMQRDVTLIFDFDYNSIILFLILLRIWIFLLM